MTLHVGIDPGLNGAVAFVGGGMAMVFDTPTLNLARGKTTRHAYNERAMANLLSSCSTPMHVTIEDVHSMPGQGVASTFTFGQGFGIWLGILAALGRPYDRVSPVRWKKAMLADMAAGKDASRLRAMQLFPERADDLARKKDDGRAEALLIAEYGRRTTGDER